MKKETWEILEGIAAFGMFIIGSILSVLFFLSFHGCASTKTFSPQCIHSALMACSVMESYGYMNVVGIQKTDVEGSYHAQCYAYDHESKEWKWVVLDRAPNVEWGSKEHGDIVFSWTKEETLGKCYNHNLNDSK